MIPTLAFARAARTVAARRGRSSPAEGNAETKCSLKYSEYRFNMRIFGYRLLSGVILRVHMATATPTHRSFYYQFCHKVILVLLFSRSMCLSSDIQARKGEGGRLLRLWAKEQRKKHSRRDPILCVRSHIHENGRNSQVDIRM